MRDEAFRKLRVTDDEIRKDLLYARTRVYKDRAIGFSMPMLLLMPIVIGLAFAPPFVWLSLALGAVVLVVAGLVVVEIILWKRFCKSVREQKITVCRSRLETVCRVPAESVPLKSAFLFYDDRAMDTYCYQFKDGTWYCYKTLYYSWSPDMYMSSAGLFNSSMPEDEFYLVIDPDGYTILYIYNTKFFEYQPLNS